jgi:predicted NBD/HSP70 family sugar kinase
MGAEVRRDHRETWQSATAILRAMTTSADRSALLARYKDGAAAVTAAVEGLSDDDLDRRPAPDEWTAREVVHHLADAEARSAIRLRQLLAEDAPTIQGYDEELYARALHYDRPIATSLALVDAVRASTAELLDRLTDTDFARCGTHTESGRYSVDTWLELYAAHAHDHADQLRRAATG